MGTTFWCVIWYLIGCLSGVFGIGMTKSAKRGDRMIGINDVPGEDKETEE